MVRHLQYVMRSCGCTFGKSQATPTQEDLKKKEAERSFVSAGRSDVLIVATGKPDHGGRVRGIGGQVGVKEFFGSSAKCHRQSMVAREEMEQTVAKLNEEAAVKEARYQSDMSQLREELNQMKLLLSSRSETSVPFTHSPATVQQSTGESCIVGQSEQPCDLYVEDPDHHDRLLLVAKGTVHNLLGSTVHHQQMSDDEVRVSVEKMIIDAPLPLPTDEMKLVSDVKGTFISWPVKVVHVCTPPEASIPRPQASSPPQASSLPQAPTPPQAQSPIAKLIGCKKISDMVKSGVFKDKSWLVDEVVGVPHPLPVQVDTVDIESLLLPRQELSDAII